MAQCLVPEGAQVVKGLGDFFGRVKLFLKLVGLFLVDYSAGSVGAQEAGFERGFLVGVGKEFFGVVVFDVAQNKNRGLGLAGLKSDFQAVACDRRPTVGH